MSSNPILNTVEACVAGIDAVIPLLNSAKTVVKQINDGERVVAPGSAFENGVKRLSTYRYNEGGSRFVREWYARDGEVAFEVKALIEKVKEYVCLDLEWDNQATFPAIMQVAYDNWAIVFHMSSGDNVPTWLKIMLEHENIVKIGSGIANDQIMLANMEIQIKSYWDLSDVACFADSFWRRFEHHPCFICPGPFGEGQRILDPLPLRSSPSPPISLQRMCARYLRAYLVKDEGIVRGHWSGPLNEEQLTYAVSDVFCILDILAALHDWGVSISSDGSINFTMSFKSPYDIPTSSCSHGSIVDRMRVLADSASKAHSSLAKLITPLQALTRRVPVIE